MTRTRLIAVSVMTAVIMISGTAVHAATTPGTPVTISIPSIKVSTKIEAIGVDKNGILGLPKKVTNIAWYKYGPNPGERGTAVLWGHLDTTKGPSTLWNLKKVRVGQEIVITDSAKKVYRYRVTRSVTYPVSKPPMKELFGTTKKYQLVIYTCAGHWVRSIHNYSDRLFVFAELVR